ncbi:metallophosphoesterase family protein [Gaoshiqia sediminis]|uniref:Metallophosphatase family protein n=1 Tax=Gaoshiqia sediminis TaxID=2986998 RepID=A0AA41YAV6_9BACT|nr:metallophosphoesterase family protein [Gaoshiqia sediminis]MCW0484931.1 metallophosphatase family protein [Gaoshiqia sediminis]
MKRVGLISDTHGSISSRTLNFLETVDEIWHAGDIGTVELADELARLKPFRAVYGNIDDHILRRMYPENQRFFCEDVDVLMTHIGGYPGHYDVRIRQEIYSKPPKLFISGHSHILRVIFDKKINCLHINPGASGNKGFHTICTAVRFIIDGSTIRDLEILEFERVQF